MKYKSNNLRHQDGDMQIAAIVTFVQIWPNLRREHNAAKITKYFPYNTAFY